MNCVSLPGNKVHKSEEEVKGISVYRKSDRDFFLSKRCEYFPKSGAAPKRNLMNLGILEASAVTFMKVYWSSFNKKD